MDILSDLHHFYTDIDEFRQNKMSEFI